MAGGVFYVVSNSDETINASNSRTNAQSGNGNANTSFSTENWLEYVDQNVRLRHPSDWHVTRAVLSGGSFATGNRQAVIIQPPSIEIDFKPAARCTVQDFPSEGKTLEAWLAASSLYTDTSLSVLASEPLRIGETDGMDVTEGGPNAQQTRSYFFMSQDTETIVRFGYYLGVDTAPREAFEEVKNTCGEILGTLADV